MAQLRIPLDAKRFATEFCAFLDARHPEVSAGIRETGDLSDEAEATMKTALADFQASFRPTETGPGSEAALGETTPGPLIMVVAFVGFVGAYTHSVFGPEAPALAGCAGALAAGFFTFLPSFLFIFLGGPLVESTHGDLRFTAPLTGITAAVVGVILNLAVFFAWHVFWPQGFGGRFDAFSALVGAAALAALWRYKTGMIPVILSCGFVGLIYHLVPG